MEKAALVIAGLIVVALLSAIPFAIHQNIEWTKACKEAGGVPYNMYKSEDICLNPSAIVELNK
jgi:hypothetical protein